MSRESDFIREITKLTHDGKLQWSNVPPGKYADYIFQSPFAYQAFVTPFSKGNTTYQLLLVHKKVPADNLDFEVREERHATELLALSGGRLLSTFNEYTVEDRDLQALSALVDQENKELNELLS